jgi:hypothetical protein
VTLATPAKASQNDRNGLELLLPLPWLSANWKASFSACSRQGCLPVPP